MGREDWSAADQRFIGWMHSQMHCSATMLTSSPGGHHEHDVVEVGAYQGAVRGDWDHLRNLGHNWNKTKTKQLSSLPSSKIWSWRGEQSPLKEFVKRFKTCSISDKKWAQNISPNDNFSPEPGGRVNPRTAWWCHSVLCLALNDGVTPCYAFIRIESVLITMEAMRMQGRMRLVK